MGIKLKPRQEKLAKAVAKGVSLKKAAKQAGYTGSESSACEIVKNPKVSERITELREKAEDAMECNRLNFIRTIHSRFINEEHKDAAKYGEMLAKAQGWNEPDKVELNGEVDIIVRIGGKTSDHH